MQNEKQKAPRKRLTNGGLEQIIESARFFFAKRGFHQTGMAELAERAGVSVGQVYRLFASKSDIIIAIVREDASQRLGTLAEINASVENGTLPIRAALQQLVTEAMNEGGNPLVFEILAEASRSQAAADVVNDLTVQYRRMLRGLAQQANPQLTGDRLAAAEEILMATLFGLGNRSLSWSSLPVERAAQLTADFLFAALQ